jgi:hypothetical protein
VGQDIVGRGEPRRELAPLLGLVELSICTQDVGQFGRGCGEIGVIADLLERLAR